LGRKTIVSIEAQLRESGYSEKIIEGRAKALFIAY
jgi:hypothetical protein